MSGSRHIGRYSRYLGNVACNATFAFRVHAVFSNIRCWSSPAMSQYAKEPGMTTSPHRVSHWALCWATKAPGAAISAAPNRRLRELEWRHASFHRTDILATFSIAKGLKQMIMHSVYAMLTAAI